MQSPIVSYADLTYTVSLFRSDASVKEEKLTFGEHSLSVCCATESELPSWERSQIKGPPSDDGKLYYLCAQHQDVGRASLVWLKDKEALALRKAIEDAEQFHWREEMIYREKKPCTFCGQIIRDCGEDHADEMRDIKHETYERDW